MGICYRHGRYEDTTAPGCPKCTVGEPAYMGGIIRHPDAEPDAPEPCPECSSLRARAEEALKFLRALTPGGSEYQTAEECAGYVRRVRDEQFAAIKKLKAARDEAVALSERVAVDDQKCPRCGHEFIACVSAVEIRVYEARRERDAALKRAEAAESESGRLREALRVAVATADNAIGSALAFAIQYGGRATEKAMGHAKMRIDECRALLFPSEANGGCEGE